MKPLLSRAPRGLTLRRMKPRRRLRRCSPIPPMPAHRCTSTGPTIARWKPKRLPARLWRPVNGLLFRRRSITRCSRYYAQSTEKHNRIRLRNPWRSSLRCGPLRGIIPWRTAWRFRLLALDAADVAAVACVDFDDVAGVDEKRDLDARAGFEFRGLGGPCCRIAFETGIGFFNLEFHVRGQVDADRCIAVELHGDPHPVFEKVGGIADEIFLQVDVFVGLVIHEVIAIGVVIEHLHLAIVDGCALELFAGAERAFDGRP